MTWLLCYSLLVSAISLGDDKTFDQDFSVALSSARVKHKRVFVVFVDPSRGWSQRFERLLEHPELREIIQRHFALVIISGAGKGKELDCRRLRQLKGEGEGFPYYVVVDCWEKPLISSKLLEPGAKTPVNMGFPLTKLEIEQFLTMVRVAAPDLSDSEADTVLKVLEATAATIRKRTTP